MISHRGNRRAVLLGATALVGALALAATGPAAAQETREFQFSQPVQPLSSALRAYGATADQQIIFADADIQGRTAPALNGAYTADEALGLLLIGTGLKVRRTEFGVLQIAAATDPQSGGAAGDGADGTVEALIVTAQKREEDIQDVPIAISAFTQEDLTRQQIAGGPDLITQVPNMTFTKTNFSSYSVQLRGIGTQAISATTDPAVAVAFNNTPFIRNRFFEQEFYDLQRIEVLRGPQGTLYGRNATAGVVNIISQKPKFNFESKLSADVGNFGSTRLEGMVNVPLAEDAIALRIAGAWTKRDGYATNDITGNPIDGRDLWSTRVSLRVTPNDRIDANLIWEHFQEEDDRLRSGKQLCKKHVVTDVGGVPVTYFQGTPDRGQGGTLVQMTLSQGCERASLYSPESFQTPNGLMLPYYKPLASVTLPAALDDPYLSTVQSPDLRVIESTVDPKYKADTNIGELQVNIDLTDTLSLTSETAYSADFVYSLQDFNRFNTARGAFSNPDPLSPQRRPGILIPGEFGAYFCDPQLGCSDRLVAVDLSTAKATQFSQEFRLASNYDGPFNFSLGANFLRGDSEDKYYVFINSLSLISAGNLVVTYPDDYVPNVTDNRRCLNNGYTQGDPNGVYPVTGCIYIDPNPLESVNDQGHNYFLSKNPYKLISYAVFGEAYYQLAENLKITGGLRWTIDKKEAPRIPTWLVSSDSYGYPVAEVIEQEWREPTGCLAIDWKPDLSFTDETLIYGSYAHGYKAGGANPPGYVRVFYAAPSEVLGSARQSATRPRTFDPEFIDAFELGAKNTLLDGRMTLNLAGFYYDYRGYQVSEIVDRSAFNRNFDATVWGIELEADWRPLENLRLGFKGGYEKTRIADGEQAVDLMDRTAGHEGWVVSRPFPTMASNCVLPDYVFVQDGEVKNPGGLSGGNPTACEFAYLQNVDPMTLQPYDPDFDPNLIPYPFQGYADYPGFDPLDESQGHNHGEGFYKQLGGNALPNAPELTATITADYTIPLPKEWLATLHTDLHWQSESWWRVFNDHEYDKLDEYFTMNLAAIFTNEDAGWTVMAYVKNVTDETAITGAFLNSDDTGLTTNVFLTEPRLYGLRVTKEWSGAPGIGLFGDERGPHPWTLELGGQVQHHEAPTQAVDPTFSDEMSPSLRIFDDVQGRDLDWGDGRSVKLAYRPPNTPWWIALGARFSETNAKDATRVDELNDTGCAFSFAFCEVSDPILGWTYQGLDYSDVTVVSKEEHTIVDFTMGRDLGLGNGTQAALGLRYAKLGSRRHVSMMAIDDFTIPDEWALIKYSTKDRYTADFDIQREFDGLGPTVSWEGSAPFAGDEETGRFTGDWSLTGGLLFGKQKVTAAGQEFAIPYEGIYQHMSPGEPVVTAAPASRSESVAVPVLDLSLGLSYEKGRAKVSAGYRWERYFNALDGGFDHASDVDRTMDGPYFTFAVGFGR